MKTIIALILGATAFGQNPTGQAKTAAPCSPAITGSGNTIIIKTCDMGLAESQRFRQLLKNIVVAQKADTALIINKLDECFTKMANRHLTDEQKSAILAAITPLAGHEITLAVPLGNSETKNYAMDFVDLFRTAHWSGVSGTGVNQAVYDKDPIGTEITVNDADAKMGKVPPDAVMLVQLFATLGLAQLGPDHKPSLFVNPQVPSGKVEIRIGGKPE